MPLSIAASIYLFKITSFKYYKYLLVFILLVLLCMVLGLSRGVYVGLAAMAIFYLVFAARKIINITNIFYTTLTILLVAFGAYIFISYSHPEAIGRFINQATLGDFSAGESVQKRLIDYQKAYEYFQEKPYLGIGPGNYGARYLDYPSHDTVDHWEVVNNQYLEILAEWGIIGFILYITMLIWFFTRSLFIYKKTQDPYLKALLFGSTAAMLAILVQYNFFSTIYIMHIWVYIGLVIAIQNIAKRSYEKA
jgi:O-antigen ligase